MPLIQWIRQLLYGSVDLTGTTTGAAVATGTVSTVVTALGGTFEWKLGLLTGLKLVIPPGAVSSPTTITASYDYTPYPGFLASGLAVKFDTVTFLLPVTLTLPLVLPPGYALRNATIVKRGDDSSIHSLLTDRDGIANTLTIQTTTFSGFAAAVPAGHFARPCNPVDGFLRLKPATKLVRRCECFIPACWRTYTATFWLLPGFGCAHCCGPGFVEQSWTTNTEADLEINIGYNAVGCADFCTNASAIPWTLSSVPAWTIIYEDIFIRVWAVSFRDVNKETCPNGPNIHADPLCSTINPHYFPEPGNIERTNPNQTPPCPASYSLTGAGPPSDFGCGSP